MTSYVTKAQYDELVARLDRLERMNNPPVVAHHFDMKGGFKVSPAVRRVFDALALEQKRNRA